MTIQKIKSGRVNNVDADNFVGEKGTIFFNESLGDLRISDGLTVGGIPLSFGGGGGNGNYILPTASTTIKGGVKIDGTTIRISNQVISGFSGSYTDLTDKPTIPTNTNQLTNGSGYITSSSLTGLATESYVTSRGYITSSALTGLATESYVTGRGYITSSALSGYALTSAIPTNNNQLTNGSNYITASALTGYATESYVTGRGYITTSALTGYALTSAIPTDISQLTDNNHLLGQGGGGGGTTYITNNVENPFSFSVAGDDSTLREIANGESIKITGAGGITVTTDDEGKITITGPNLSSYATQSYVTSQGYITSSSLTGLATESYVTSRGYITSSALTGLATESFVTSRGYITGLSWSQLTDKPNLAGTYTFNIAGTDSTLHQVNADNTIQFKGNGNITVATTADGVITIDIPSAMVYHSDTAPSTPTIGELWWDSVGGNLYIYYDNTWVISNDYANITDYNQLTGLPDLSVYALAADVIQAEAYSFNITADDSTVREITNNETIKFIGASGITTSSDADGNITITGGAQDRLTSNARSAVLNSNGTFSLPALTAAPTSPQAGQMALADGVNWNPMSQSGTSPYMVIYTGTGWIGLGGGVNMDQVYTAIIEFGAAAL